MKCSRCGRETAEEQGFMYQGRFVCEDCFIELGLHPKECEPWATYIATHTAGTKVAKSLQALTDLQKQVHEFIKSSGKVSRNEVMKKFKFSEADMDAQMTALFHNEMVKEHREKNTVYLIPIG